MKKLLTPLTRLSTRMKLWLLTLLASVVLVGFGYMAVQQQYRQTANDPLNATLARVESYVSAGVSPQQLSGSGQTDPSKSLDQFLVVTDDNLKVQGATLQMGGNTPLPPKSVFDAVKDGGSKEFTWEMSNGTRVAVVMKHFKGAKQSGFILVGSSLSQVEKHERQLTAMAAITFVLLAVISALGAFKVMAPRAEKVKLATAASSAPLTFEEPTVAEATPVAEEKKASKAKSTSKKPAAKKSSAKKSTRSNKK